MAEGRLEANYQDERSVHLDKPDLWFTGKEMKEALKDKDAISAVRFFRTFSDCGFPYGSAWAYNPNMCVEIVEMLMPLKNIYQPRLN